MRKMALDTTGEVGYTEGSERLPGSIESQANGLFVAHHISTPFDALGGGVGAKTGFPLARLLPGNLHPLQVRFCVPGEMPR
jgi:hypothetical protein